MASWISYAKYYIFYYFLYSIPKTPYKTTYGIWLKIDHTESDALFILGELSNFAELNMQPTILVIDMILHLQFDLVYSIPSMVKFFGQLSGHAITTIRVEPIDENE